LGSDSFIPASPAASNVIQEVTILTFLSFASGIDSASIWDAALPKASLVLALLYIFLLLYFIYKLYCNHRFLKPMAEK
jgi:hypothetical protein